MKSTRCRTTTTLLCSRAILSAAAIFSVSYVVPARADQPEQVRSLPLSAVSQERLSSALGHFSRARSLLVAALQEFDKGKRLADPDPLVSSVEWRGTVIEKAKELERILDPQARTSHTGVKYDSDPRLLSEAK